MKSKNKPSFGSLVTNARQVPAPEIDVSAKVRQALHRTSAASARSGESLLDVIVFWFMRPALQKVSVGVSLSIVALFVMVWCLVQPEQIALDQLSLLSNLFGKL